MPGQVTISDGTLMASDFPPGTTGDPQKGFSTAPDVPIAKAIFGQLAEGGTIIDDVKPTFFSPGFSPEFVRVRNKFGTHWIISALPAKGAPT